MNEDADAIAKQRFFALSILRIGGALLAVFGLIITAGRFPNIPVVAGYVMVVIGLIDFLIIPRWLASKWKSPTDL